MEIANEISRPGVMNKGNLSVSVKDRCYTFMTILYHYFLKYLLSLLSIFMRQDVVVFCKIWWYSIVNMPSCGYYLDITSLSARS